MNLYRIILPVSNMEKAVSFYSEARIGKVSASLLETLYAFG